MDLTDLAAVITIATKDELADTIAVLQAISAALEKHAAEIRENSKAAELQNDRLIKALHRHTQAVEDSEQTWKQSWADIRKDIAFDVYANNYISQMDFHESRKLSQTARDEAVLEEARRISSSALRSVQEANASTQSILKAVEKGLSLKLEDVAAAANGLPPLPTRPIETTLAGLATYHLKAIAIRTRRFFIEARSAAIVLSSGALVLIAIEGLHHAGFPLQLFTGR
ncbi:hypothetical protein [Burkholderia sp. Ac-20365]|uniref:hypothetical protein n=1 Tax=Burkholderia sp. Ac-20365 TaxID=2703897 RepID=UPI00197C29A8|nr:hypothetical protein [Burkholderia sp. Ac-20365]MBN3761083.1 hypothetical protein [Burkholderia sp. Ac-20365]